MLSGGQKIYVSEKHELLKKNIWSNIDFLIKILNDSPRFCMEKLKNTVLRPKNPKLNKKIPPTPKRKYVNKFLY